MNPLDYGYAVYLILLAIGLVGWFLVNNRASLNKTMQQAAAWALIFLGAIAVAGLWDDIQRSVMPTQATFIDANQIAVPRQQDGHYYLTLTINDVPVQFVIDTGATEMVLTHRDAERIGLSLDNLAYLGRAMTANGEVRTAPVRLQTVRLGKIVDTDFQAWVNEGEMGGSLLGMAYLQRFSRIAIEGNQMVLSR